MNQILFWLIHPICPEIHEVNEEEIDEELEGLTLKQLEELQHTIDQEIDESQDDQYNDTEDQ